MRRMKEEEAERVEEEEVEGLPPSAGGADVCRLRIRAVHGLTAVTPSSERAAVGAMRPPADAEEADRPIAAPAAAGKGDPQLLADAQIPAVRPLVEGWANREAARRARRRAVEGRIFGEARLMATTRPGQKPMASPRGWPPERPSPRSMVWDL